MTLVTDVLSAAAACVAVGALVRVAQFAASKDVEKATVKQHARAIALHAGVTAVAVAALAAVYWAVTALFYAPPHVPELVPGPASQLTTLDARPPLLQPVSELRELMKANVTPRAPPPMKPVLTPAFR